MKSPQKIRALFLDFDGVLHPPRAIAGATPPLTPAQIRAGWPQTFEHLPLLATLLKGHHNIAVVVSSSWRLYLDESALADLLSPLKPWFAGAVNQRVVRRDLAILEWLDQHAITDFVVLDDVARFFEGSWPSLILCNSALGLSDPQAQKRLQQWLGQA